MSPPANTQAPAAWSSSRMAAIFRMMGSSTSGGGTCVSVWLIHADQVLWHRRDLLVHRVVRWGLTT